MLRARYLLLSFGIGMGACLMACVGADEDGAGGSGASATSVGPSGNGPAQTGTGAGTASTAAQGTGNASTTTSSGSGAGIAAAYPGDAGIENDPAVVWAEMFEEGSVDGVTSRYDDFKNPDGMSLVADVPAGSSGSAAMKLTAGDGADATDFYKMFPQGYDELYVRWYAKYDAGGQWHHTGVWFGGYDPPTSYPNPQAGLKPDGDDRFAIAIEPTEQGTNPRLDFYNYWMTMHSWMDDPQGDTAYYGNALIHDASLHVQDDQWMCIEVHLKVNPDPSSPGGAELAMWFNDHLERDFTDTAPLGYWIKDKFCPDGTDANECTDYPPAPGEPHIPLDLQMRNEPNLKLNYFWPQNYITDAPSASVYYDHMVVATQRIGCLQ